MSRKKVKPTHRGLVLAEGEVTSHAHVIKDTEKAEMFEDDNNEKTIVTSGEVEITHEEHMPIKIGEEDKTESFKVGIVREQDPFLEEAREVRD